MTCSMTAFARCEQRGDLGELIWELRSVNHRYLEPSLRLPEELRQVETAVRERLGARLSRGKIDCGLRYRPTAAVQGQIELNTDLAGQLASAADNLARQLGGDWTRPSLMDLLQWPGVIEQQRPDLEPVIEQALALLDQAIDQLIANREREGERLAELIRQRAEALRQQVVLARERMPEVIDSVRKRLRERLAEFGDQLEPGRLEQEMAILSQRLDVDEEMDRLQSHLSEIESVLRRREPIGRRLDFLMQELNREANTLGSKSSDLTITQCGVEMKVLIEQMREQIQNIE
ncbi:MAG: YicC family protein [Gammaproteobacteria bacterium]|nr:YicC family protein [Gammaproteobacteria bacterium]